MIHFLLPLFSLLLSPSLIYYFLVSIFGTRLFSFLTFPHRINMFWETFSPARVPRPSGFPFLFFQMGLATRNGRPVVILFLLAFPFPSSSFASSRAQTVSQSAFLSARRFPRSHFSFPFLFSTREPRRRTLSLFLQTLPPLQKFRALCSCTARIRHTV